MEKQIVLIDFKSEYAMKLQIRPEDRGRLIITYFNECLKLAVEQNRIL